MNNSLKIKKNCNLEEIYLNFDSKDKMSHETKSLNRIFDYLSMKDIISFKNTSQFFNKKFDIEFIKKVSKGKILNRKEHLYLIRKIIITPE
jgi:hypothetical protein